MRDGKREEEGHCLATPLDHLVRAHAHPSLSIVTVRAPSIPSPAIQTTCVTLHNSPQKFATDCQHISFGTSCHLTQSPRKNRGQAVEALRFKSEGRGVLFPVVLLEFFIDIILPAFRPNYGTGVDSASTLQKYVPCIALLSCHVMQ